MKVAVFSAKPYDKKFLDVANQQHRHELKFFTPMPRHGNCRPRSGF